MNHYKSYFTKIDPLLSAAAGAAVFFLLFGFAALDINGYRLFSHGDPGMHYIGWRFFREAAWQLKPGLMNNIHYPYSISVIFTDSVPVAAVFFKLFRGVLTENFNYFGLWTLLCFILQGFFAERILALRIENRLLKFVGVCFFLITPALLKRAFWHTALTSHFLILAALYMLLDTGEGFIKELLYWGILGFLCASIHIYFLGMCGLICLFAAIDRGRRDRYSVPQCFMIPLSFLVCGVITVWILGGLDSGMMSGAPGFGYYSF
ncbi:MAG: DUF6311 domain-containing protein, partial [Lachnospiraceae bacterium]|nr:DUF6311 domain-containing protein [Lachnospiraceae bacterium]